MKNLLFLLMFVLLLSGAVFGQCREYSPATSKLVFCPPANWKGWQEKDSKFLTFGDKMPNEPGAGTSLIVREGEKLLDIEATSMIYVKEAMKPEKDMTKSLIEAADFTTATGLTGTRFVLLMEVRSPEGIKIPVRQATYMIDSGGKTIYTFISTSLAADRAVVAAVDASMKTVRTAK